MDRLHVLQASARFFQALCERVLNQRVNVLDGIQILPDVLPYYCPPRFHIWGRITCRDPERRRCHLKSINYLYFSVLTKKIANLILERHCPLFLVIKKKSCRAILVNPYDQQATFNKFLVGIRIQHSAMTTGPRVYIRFLFL